MGTIWCSFFRALDGSNTAPASLIAHQPLSRLKLYNTTEGVPLDLFVLRKSMTPPVAYGSGGCSAKAATVKSNSALVRIVGFMVAGFNRNRVARQFLRLIILLLDENATKIGR